MTPSSPAGVRDFSSLPSQVHATPDPSFPRPAALGSCIAALALLGALGMAPVLLKLWDTWTDDPLKSIGMLIVPIAVILTLRVWRQSGWGLRGSWWGLLPVTLALCISVFRHRLGWMLFLGPYSFNILAPKVALLLFGVGFMLLFAGPRVCRRAWFPLALFFCAQPMPYFLLLYGDVPLQDLSAHIARSFAVLIGFPPASKELLRLMFSADFGMFIAPGCDGVRGALTLGYLGLITGYLKKVSVPRWIAYVAGGALLGYLFNLIRLCALVLYYRLAMGHPRMEHFAKNADYLIGGCLFLVAAVLFLWIVSRKDKSPTAPAAPSARPPAWTPREKRTSLWRAAAFAVPALLLAVPGVHAIRGYRRTFSAEVRTGIIRPAQLDALLPKQAGGYTLSRAWQETANGQVLVESGAYDQPSHDEVTLGVWLPPSWHNLHVSWMVRGEDPLQRGDRAFITANRQSVRFDTAFYSDGITDSVAGNIFCSPTNCVPSETRGRTEMDLSIDPPEFDSPGNRSIPIFFTIDRPHTAGPQAAVDQELTSEAQQFLAGLDLGAISREFQ